MTNASPWVSETVLEAAAATVSAHLRVTPLIPYRLPHRQAPIFLKLDTLQPTGSFKVRGALAATAAYAGLGLRIVTASAGNHGLGIAHAAATLGVTATVVVPRNASAAKIAALRTYPVDLRLVGDSYEEAERHAQHLAETDGHFVSAYNDPYVIAGQATLVQEVRRQLSGDFTIAIPLGGGGLLSGTALAASRMGEAVEVVGVEATESQAVSSAVLAGHHVEVPIGTTIADGLAGNIDPAALTPDLIRAAGVSLCHVPESAIRQAMRDLATQAGLVVEGSGAVGLAALSGGLLPPTATVVLALTGRNVAGALFRQILDEGAPASGQP